MGQTLRFAKLHHRRDTLQRMKTPEQLLDDGWRRITADCRLDQQQAVPHRREVLLRLGEVVLHERRDEIDGLIRHRQAHASALCDRARASSSATDAARTEGENGFVI
jgi:hypothetical protein